MSGFAIPQAASATDLAAMRLASAKGVYTALQTADTKVTGANVRVNMLPANILTGNQSIPVAANQMPVGSSLYIVSGTGTIGARLTTPPGFNLVPWVTPQGGSKTDLPGFAKAPLLGADGYCSILLEYAQTAAGIVTSGVVAYWTDQLYYAISINPGATGFGGDTLPTAVVSDPSVPREFGCDGFWGTGADNREYVRSRRVRAMIVGNI